MSHELFDLNFWRDRGWKVPMDFELNEVDDEIDYTFQYLMSIPISSQINSKSNFMQKELRFKIIECLKRDLEFEKQEGWSHCLTKINLHLGEIVDDSFYVDPSINRNGNPCVTCGKVSPDTFDLCWFCGRLLTENEKVIAFANLFIEITASTSLEDLGKWQYDEGPSRWAEIEWESIVRDYFEGLCTLPDSEFIIVDNEDGDATFNADGFEITVRFNPSAMID